MHDSGAIFQPSFGPRIWSRFLQLCTYTGPHKALTRPRHTHTHTHARHNRHQPATIKITGRWRERGNASATVCAAKNSLANCSPPFPPLRCTRPRRLTRPRSISPPVGTEIGPAQGGQRVQFGAVELTIVFMIARKLHHAVSYICDCWGRCR